MAASRKFIRSLLSSHKSRRCSSNYSKRPILSNLAGRMCPSLKLDRPSSHTKTKVICAENKSPSKDCDPDKMQSNSRDSTKHNENSNEEEPFIYSGSSDVSRRRWSTSVLYHSDNPPTTDSRTSTTDAETDNIARLFSRLSLQGAPSSTSSTILPKESSTNTSLELVPKASKSFLGHCDAVTSLSKSSLEATYQSEPSSLEGTEVALSSSTDSASQAAGTGEISWTSFTWLTAKASPLPAWASRNVTPRMVSARKVWARLNLSASYIRGNAPLVLRRALCMSDVAVVRTLAELAPNVIAGPAGEDALVTAAEEGQVTMVSALLALGVDPEAGAARRVDRDGWSPLHAATYHGHARCVAALLRSNANVNAVSSAGLTPLHVAAVHNHADCAAALLSAGADVDAVDDAEKTPAAYAEEFGNFEFLATIYQCRPPSPRK